MIHVGLFRLKFVQHISSAFLFALKMTSVTHHSMFRTSDSDARQMCIIYMESLSLLPITSHNFRGTFSSCHVILACMPLQKRQDWSHEVTQTWMIECMHFIVSWWWCHTCLVLPVLFFAYFFAPPPSFCDEKLQKKKKKKKKAFTHILSKPSLCKVQQLSITVPG